MLIQAHEGFNRFISPGIPVQTNLIFAFPEAIQTL